MRVRDAIIRKLNVEMFMILIIAKANPDRLRAAPPMEVAPCTAALRRRGNIRWLSSAPGTPNISARASNRSKMIWRTPIISPGSTSASLTWASRGRRFLQIGRSSHGIAQQSSSAAWPYATCYVVGAREQAAQVTEDVWRQNVPEQFLAMLGLLANEREEALVTLAQ